VQEAIGDILIIRSERGESLLSAALAADSLDLAQTIRNHPNFDFSRQDPGRCLAAAVQTNDCRRLEFLSQFPEIDLNAPLPHGLNGFPDVFSRSEAKRVKWKGRGLILREGAPIMSAIGDQFLAMLFETPLVDPNQRGKQGETAAFHVAAFYLARPETRDNNATDRHGNKAVFCSMLARFLSHSTRHVTLKCDFQARNENSETMGEIIRNWAKRTGFRRNTRLKHPDHH
jgi:hypothetical protein